MKEKNKDQGTKTWKFELRFFLKSYSVYSIHPKVIAID